LDRRRFLKYAGATVAVVGASALGLDYLVRNTQISSQQTGQTLIPTSSSLGTASVSSSSSTQLVSLQGRLFFDYNGNGMQDSDKPPVQNAKVRIKGSNLQVIAETLTDSSGDYKLDIPSGDYKLFIQPDNSKSDSPIFTYMCRSPSEFRAIASGYDLPVVGDDTFDVGLMEGPFTQPFRSSTKYYVGTYFNWDSRSKETINSPYLWWNGQSGNNSDLVMYNNGGIDMPMDEGTDVLAPAPGQMYGTQTGSRGQLGLSIVHPDLSLGRSGTFFNHLSEILLPMGTTFARGDVIAKSGKTGTPIPHLHFSYWHDFRYDSGDQYADGIGGFDFYQPVFEITSKTSGYWFPDEFTWHSVPLGTSPNGRNLWTRLNKPVFFQ